MESIGKGKIIIVDKKKVYDGSLPYKKGTEVFLIKRSDLESILEGEISILLASKKKMPKRWYDIEKKDAYPLFEDEIDYISKEGLKFKLFLDRHTYSNNQKDMIWIRYVSVDQSSIEERETFNNGKIH